LIWLITKVSDYMTCVANTSEVTTSEQSRIEMCNYCYYYYFQCSKGNIIIKIIQKINKSENMYCAIYKWKAHHLIGDSEYLPIFAQYGG